MSETIPKQIGRFRVQSELGRGGFGRVFKAFDPTVSRLVAIKVLTEGGKDILTRFKNEATVAGNLRHENIVTVYEYGEHEGKPFLAMEFLEGEDLQHIIHSKRPLSLMQKCQIMSLVAEGLHCAHRNGVIHRDVKPANIMVLADGGVKIMDFGIARILRDDKATRLTQEGHMLGTLLYMAPEQFHGSGTDVLCDIFAYGVIFQELITGKHPFAAADAHALMYRISFAEPSPLESSDPGLPEGLQQIITRLLQKDREQRYQSLRDVQFDIGPILIDLRQKQALELLGQAQEVYGSGDLDKAQALVLEVLNLDPADKVARALWEDLQQQLRLRTVQPRIDALVNQGQEQFAERRFEDAAQSFEAARKLDPDNSLIQGQLKQARGHLERSRKAAMLLLASRRDFEKQNYTGAYKSLSEALQYDPQNSDVTAALEEVRNAIEQRQREKHLDEALAKVGALVAMRSYDEALAVLDALGPEAASPKVAGLVESVRAEKENYERKQRLHGEMANITDLLRDGLFEEAVERLQILRAEFPDNEEIGHLQAYAERELTVRQRVECVGTIASDAGALLNAQEFEGALELINQGLNRYPGESALIRLMGSAIAAKADWECRQAVQSTLDNCTRLRGEQRFAEAIEVVEAALRDYSGETQLLDLLHELERELASQRRTQAIQSAHGEARKLLEHGQPEKAAQFIRRALVRYPNESALTEVLEEAQDETRKRERQRALDAIGREAAACLAANDFAGALNALARGLEAWPGEPGLLRQQEAARAAQAASARDRAIRETVRRATTLGAEKQFPAAITLVEEALSEYPGESLLERLKQQLEFQWKAVERRETIGRIGEPDQRREPVAKAAADAAAVETRWVEQIEPQIGAGDLGKAAALLSLAEVECPGSAALQDLRRQLDQAASRQSLLNSLLDARTAIHKDWRAAETLITEARAADSSSLPEVPEAAIAGRQQEDVAEQPRSRAAVVRKRVMLAAGLAAALAAGAGGLRVLTRPPNLVPVTITTTPADAAISAGQEACPSSGCVLKLKPGTYTIEASREGYKPASRQITVGAASAEPVHLSLDPLLPQIQISTNFASGSVRLDGTSAAELRNGQLTLRDLSFGKHRLTVTSPDGQATVAFEMAAGRVPATTGKLEARDADAIVVGNLGPSARLECNCSNDKVTVDGKTVGELSPNGIDLSDLTKGNKTVQVGGRFLEFSVQQEPVLNLFLTSDRNIGTLAIEANVENPTVIIDKKRYPGTASHGPIRIPLNAARYTVTLQKNGYRSPAPQTVEIQKGGTGKLVFRLDPMNTAVKTVETVDPIVNPDKNALEEARRKAEQAAWDAVNKNDRAALQQYLNQHAGGPFATDASNLINKLDRAEKQRADEQKRDEDQRKARQAEEQRKAMEAQRKSAQEEEQRKKAAEAAALRQQKEEAQRRAAAEKEGILEVLKQYSSAYRRRDAAAVKAVFPEVPKYGTIVSSFKIFRSYELTLEPAEAQITGDSAVVRCQRTIKVADEHGPQPPRSDTVTFRLQKTAGRWLILSLQ